MKYLKSYEKLFELHYTDTYPQGFLDFRKKWNKIKRGSYSDTYYVQFTNYNDSNINKSATENTDHSDPMGTYGYPLKYVIDYPADVWYGKNAKYLRVLEKTNGRSLYINLIKDRRSCVEYLSDIFKDMYISEIETMINRARKKEPSRITGSATWAKTFFLCIQADFTGSDEEWHEKEKKSTKIRSSKEQTELFIKGGWDVIIDEARSINTAIINDREPNQAIFLKPTTFKVVDVFNLIDKKEVNKDLVTPSHGDVLGRKWASKILNELDGDKIKEQGKDYTNTWFFSVGGREIILNFEERDTSYREDIKMGQKRHKAHKLYDGYSVKIYIATEYGDITTRVYEDGKFDEELDYISYKWEELKKGEKIPNWEKRSRKLQDTKDAEERSKYAEERIKKKEREYKKKFERWKPRMEYWNEKANTDFKFFELGRMQKYMEILDSLDFRFNSIDKNVDLEKHYSDIDKYFDDIIITDEEEKFVMTMMFGGEEEEDYTNAREFVKIIKKVAEVAHPTSSFIEFTFWTEK